MVKPIGADDADTIVFTILMCFTWKRIVAVNSPNGLPLYARHKAENTHNY
jgi:hypothetical protein